MATSGPGAALLQEGRAQQEEGKRQYVFSLKYCRQ